ncbi:hypothetical protein MAP00_007428 [Monascus purpureus]|nr:hypothetical protein MAP00_007428 [Monascus purpureus]
MVTVMVTVMVQAALSHTLTKGIDTNSENSMHSLMIQDINPSYKAARQPESLANLSHYFNTEKFLKIYAALLTDDFG